MALLVKDRVQETSSTTGTGTFTLAGAVTGFETFSGSIGNGNTTFYTITNGAEWEVGLGTVAAGTLARTTVYQSSNGDALVNFSAGTKNVFCTYPADQAIYRLNLPTKLIVTVRAGTTVDVSVANGILSILNRSGSTISVTIN
jgi:hypothetical protein